MSYSDSPHNKKVIDVGNLIGHPYPAGHRKENEEIRRITT
jgi:hypothetical protein